MAIRFDVTVGYVDRDKCIERQKFEQEPHEYLQEFQSRIFEWVVNQSDQLIEDEELDNDSD